MNIKERNIWKILSLNKKYEKRNIRKLLNQQENMEK